MNNGQQGVTVQSVSRALDILACFDGANSSLGLLEIAERMSLSKSTIYGLVNTLVVKGYLERDTQTKRYRLGIKLFELGKLVERRMDLYADVRPFCEELSKKCDACVHLAARYGGDVIYIGKVDTPDAIVVYSQPGKRVPLHCTGVGKAILMVLPEEEQLRYLGGELQRFTPNTITSPPQLLDNLSISRLRGYAIDDEEIELGLRCVAAPIFNHNGEPVAAISVSAPVARMPMDSIGAIAEQALYFAAQISHRLGFTGAPT